MPEELVEAIASAQMDARHDHLDALLRYAYLWPREHEEGREESTKDRPCAIVMTALVGDGETKVLVVPVTPSAPANSATAIELPPAFKTHLGLDDARSRVVLTESNLFDWPGPDLRRVGDRDNSSIADGFLPPRFFCGAAQAVPRA